MGECIKLILDFGLSPKTKCLWAIQRDWALSNWKIQNRSTLELLSSEWLTINRSGFINMRKISQRVQFSSVTQSCLASCNPMICSTPGLPIRHQLLEFTQTQVHQVGDAIQPSHPLSSPSPASNPSQHQGFFQWVNFSHQVAKVLEFQLQHQFFQWTPRTDLL